MKQQVRTQKENYEKELIEYKNVVGVGSGYKNDSDEECVKIFVNEKLSEEELDDSDIVPKELGEGVRTDVEQIGELGIEPITPQSPKDTGETDTTARHRPAPQGISIGHPDVTAGTAGFIAWDEAEKHGVTYAKPVGVTNNHVAANENDAEVGDNILQPGTYDGGNNTDEGRVGQLQGFVPIEDSGNKVDVAWYSIDGRRMTSYIPAVGVPTSTAEVSEGDKVKKFGRTTGLKKGDVRSTDARIRVRYSNGVKEFEDQILTDSISSGGDSGSAVVNEQGELVGLLFAGSSEVTVVNKASDVLNETGLEMNPGDVYN